MTKTAEPDGKRGVYVTGSGPVWVPEARLNEISKVISAHHRQEAEWAMWVARNVRRCV